MIHHIQTVCLQLDICDTRGAPTHTHTHVENLIRKRYHVVLESQ